MSLSSMHKQQFPKIDKQRMTVDDPSSPEEIRTSNCLSNRQHQITPKPMLGRNFYRTRDPTISVNRTKASTNS